MRSKSTRPFLLGIATFFLDKRAVGLDIVLSNKDSIGVSYRKYRSIGSKSSILTRFQPL
jgi:hypothetical protein